MSCSALIASIAHLEEENGCHDSRRWLNKVLVAEEGNENSFLTPEMGVWLSFIYLFFFFFLVIIFR